MDITPLITRMRAQFGDVERRLAAPDAFSDRQSYEKLTRDHQRLSAFLALYDSFQAKLRDLTDHRQLLTVETDPEFLDLIRAEIPPLEEEIRRLEARVMAQVLPPDANDSRNTILEIRPAAGGDEAALFAGDLLRMYTRFAERQGWKIELLSQTGTDLGGLKEVGVSLQGPDAYRLLKLESGVHRVQRIPSTESSGRIHTSTVTVAVLPEAREVDFQIDPTDLEIDVYRSSGAGGQHVNTTDSAVRITHKPTGLMVASQQERSQFRNREIAMRLLRSRLLEAKQREEQARYDANRKAQVGSGERSERIRTFNFPQNRVTDHRYGISWYNLPAILEGGLQDLLDDLHAAANRTRLEAEIAEAETAG